MDESTVEARELDNDFKLTLNPEQKSHLIIWLNTTLRSPGHASYSRHLRQILISRYNFNTSPYSVLSSPKTRPISLSYNFLTLYR